MWVCGYLDMWKYWHVECGHVDMWILCPHVHKWGSWWEEGCPLELGERLGTRAPAKPRLYIETEIWKRDCPTKRTDDVDFMIHKREPGFLIMGLTFVPIITEVRRTSGDVGTLRHMIIVALSCCACLLRWCCSNLEIPLWHWYHHHDVALACCRSLMVDCNAST